MTSSAIRRGFRLGEWTVNPLEGRLERDGDTRRLPPKTMDVLVALAERPMDMVTRDELLAAVWGERAVTDEPLTRCIGELRRELGDNPAEPEYIETIPKRGYKLIASVELLETEEVTATVEVPGSRRFHPVLWAVVIGVAIVAFVSAWQMGGPGELRRIDPTDARLSLAVLPFENLSGDEGTAPFTAGIHDDLLTVISKIGSIRSISRTSTLKYLGTTKSIPEIGRELGVSAVLEGGVQRAGDQLRINVQLIDAATDEHLWAESYDRQLTAENIFSIQSEIARAVAGQLQATLSAAESENLDTMPTANFAAYEAYLLGRQRLATRNSASLAEAVDYFQEAIELDADFALAYVGLADSHRTQIDYAGQPKREMLELSERIIERALELNDQLGEAFASLGNTKVGQYEHRAAELAFNQALALNPNYAPTYLWYGILLRAESRQEEALEVFRQGAALDPLSTVIYANIGMALRELGRFDESVAAFEKTIEIDPAFPGAYRVIGEIYWTARDRMDEAVSWFMKGMPLDSGNPRIPAFLGAMYLDLGGLPEAEQWIEQALALGPDSFVPVSIAQWVYWRTGDEERALDFARQSVAIDARDQRWFGLAHLRNDAIRAGRLEEALGLYRQHFPALVLDEDPHIDRWNMAAAIDLAYLLLRVDQGERAGMLLERSLELLPGIPRLGPDGYGVADAQIYALQNRIPEALAALRQAVDEGWRLHWWYYLESDPNLDALRRTPAFQAMLSEMKDTAAVQLSSVREAGEAAGRTEISR